jgi:hypothetical protein
VARSPDRATEPTETEQLAGIMCLALKTGKQLAWIMCLALKAGAWTMCLALKEGKQVAWIMCLALKTWHLREVTPRDSQRR